MQRLRKYLANKHETRVRKHESGAKRAMLNELFDDLYSSRRRIYGINFVRGIFFGAGSAFGGTIIIALAIWILSLFVNIPLIGDIFRDAKQTIQQRTDTSR